MDSPRLFYAGSSARARSSGREVRMSYVIVEGCSKDELCVEACPTDCIHPKSVDGEFEASPQIYIDPEGCIDCGACIPVCPTNSIFASDHVPPEKMVVIA